MQTVQPTVSQNNSAYQSKDVNLFRDTQPVVYDSKISYPQKQSTYNLGKTTLKEVDNTKKGKNEAMIEEKTKIKENYKVSNQEIKENYKITDK